MIEPINGIKARNDELWGQEAKDQDHTRPIWRLGRGIIVETWD